MVDLDKLEHILETMEKSEPASKDDEQYLAGAYEEIKALFAEESYHFPDWMVKTFPRIRDGCDARRVHEFASERIYPGIPVFQAFTRGERKWTRLME